jgi:hypothetical protein
MMKKIYSSVLLILAITSFSGCKKYLETAPDQRTKLNTPEKVGELLATAYAQADYVTFAEAASDNSEDKGVNVGDIAVENQDAYLWRDVNGRDTGTPTNFWNASYTAIAAANAALEAINSMPDQTAYLAYKGEALVARAYAHFMLVTFFAKAYDPTTSNDSPGIPYVTVPEKIVFGQYTRGTVASTYAAIEKDLLEGMPLLKDNAYKVPKYHFNQAAANAFAARFYLFKRDYAKVVTYATAVAPSGSFATIIRPWNTRYYAASANEFRIAFTQAAEPSNLLITEAASSWARNQAFYRYGMGLTLNAASYQPNVTGTSFTSQKVLSYGVPNYTLYKYLELFIRTSPNATIGFPYTMMIQFTTDEVLLNRAEAYANLGQNTLALADLNTFVSTRVQSYNSTTHAVTLAKVASFYNTNDPKEGLVKTVLDFKKQEFAQEGLRWLDIIRLGLTVRHNIKAVDNSDTFVTLAPTDPRRLFQLPSEVKLSGIDQNPR